MSLTLINLRRHFVPSGDLATNVVSFLLGSDCRVTAEHCRRVSHEAARIALLSGASPDRATVAGWLHDVSAVISPEEQLQVADEFGLEVMPEERFYPAILHQKLSAVLAKDLFGVCDAEVLGAIRCHTTLRADPVLLEMVVYVADKLAWDQPDPPPYETEVRAALAVSVRQAALAHLGWMRDQRASLRVVHPWLRDAYQSLSGMTW